MEIFRLSSGELEKDMREVLLSQSVVDLLTFVTGSYLGASYK